MVDEYLTVVLHHLTIWTICFHVSGIISGEMATFINFMISKGLKYKFVYSTLSFVSQHFVSKIMLNIRI